MFKNKGNAMTNIYTKDGRCNHDKINWDSKSADRCSFSRSIGKGRVICVIDSKAVCPPGGKVSCTIASRIVNT